MVFVAQRRMEYDLLMLRCEKQRQEQLVDDVNESDGLLVSEQLVQVPHARGVCLG